jgi:Ca-activated chloride channel homolog
VEIKRIGMLFTKAASLGFLLLLVIVGIVPTNSFGQAGRKIVPSGERAVTLNIVAVPEDSNATTEPITNKQFALYDDGMEQTVHSLSPDPSPAKIVLLIDNSLSLQADLKKLSQAVLEFAYEIYEGDQLYIVGYDEKPEIITEWTDNAKKVEAATKSLRKRGEPFLFDALSAVVDQVLRPMGGTAQKRVVVLISDGLDRGSKTTFDEALKDLQLQNITLYALQYPDRTGGALRRGQPKASEVIRKLTEETGGTALSATTPREAAKAICDELRKNRYILSYTPTNVPYNNERKLLVMAEGVKVRHKTAQPAQ